VVVVVEVLVVVPAATVVTGVLLSSSNGLTDSVVSSATAVAAAETAPIETAATIESVTSRSVLEPDRREKPAALRDKGPGGNIIMDSKGF
jgi:uncharacterized protein YbjT (DUF2867 family)